MGESTVYKLVNRLSF